MRDPKPLDQAPLAHAQHWVANATNSRFPLLIRTEGRWEGVTTISIVVSLTAVMLRTVPLGSIAVSGCCHNKKDKFSIMCSQQIHN